MKKIHIYANPVNWVPVAHDKVLKVLRPEINRQRTLSNISRILCFISVTQLLWKVTDNIECHNYSNSFYRAEPFGNLDKSRLRKRL